jgi:Domain of unknown function (DUF1735)
MRKPYPKTILFIFFFTNLFISCKREIDPSKQLEVSLAKNGFQQEFIRLSASTTNYAINVNVTGVSWSKLNKTINFHVDPALLAAYNASTGNHFELLPDSTYKIAKPDILFQPGQSSVQLPFQILTKKINPYIKYVLPVKIGSSDVAVNAAASTVLLRVLLANSYTGIYADTVTSVTSPPIIFNPGYNFTDSVVYKTLTAIDDSTILTDVGVPGMVADRMLKIIISSNTIRQILPYDDFSSGMLEFAFANAMMSNLYGYYQPAAEYIYMQYYYYSPFFFIKERLRKL